jgi:hypothetical protein
MAGTGKSTISRTVASRLKAKTSLAGSFFFKRGEEDRGNSKRLFPTLAEQLVISIPQLIPGIRKAIGDDPNISKKALREQFENTADYNGKPAKIEFLPMLPWSTDIS